MRYFYIFRDKKLYKYYLYYILNRATASSLFRDFYIFKLIVKDEFKITR